MSLEADIVEVRKLYKAFAGLANIEAALSRAVNAESQVKATLKQLEDIKVEVHVRQSEVEQAKTNKRKADDDANAIIKSAHAKSADITAHAERKAKDLILAAENTAKTILADSETTVREAQKLVEAAKLEADILKKDIVDSTTKLSKIRGAIAAVVGS